jgi:hypothetical protein
MPVNAGRQLGRQRLASARRPYLTSLHRPDRRRPFGRGGTWCVESPANLHRSARPIVVEPHTGKATGRTLRLAVYIGTMAERHPAGSGPR